AREVVADRQRITATAVTEQKITLEVCTPTLIRSGTFRKRFAIRRYPAAALTRLHQTGALQDDARRGIGRPAKFRPLLAQPVQHFFRTPMLTPQLGLYNQRSQLRRRLIGMTVRRARLFCQAWRSQFAITVYPLISRWPANLIEAAQLALAVIAA